jgi:hypothetical protein
MPDQLIDYPAGTVFRQKSDGSIWIVVAYEFGGAKIITPEGIYTTYIENLDADDRFERFSIAGMLHENALHRAAQRSFETQIDDLKLVIAGLEEKLSVTRDKKWEYKKVRTGYEVGPEVMAELSNDRWELVTSHSSSGCADFIVYWFKREVQGG